MKPKTGKVTLGLLAGATLLAQIGACAQDDLAAGFKDPPDMARPGDLQDRTRHYAGGRGAR